MSISGALGKKIRDLPTLDINNRNRLPIRSAHTFSTASRDKIFHHIPKPFHII